MYININYSWYTVEVFTIYIGMKNKLFECIGNNKFKVNGQCFWGGWYPPEGG